MARIRTIKPEFFTSLKIDRLSLATQRTFIGLWTYVDDHGRGVDDARLIKAAIWPLRDEYTSKHVEQDMQALADLELILRYGYGEGRYFVVLGWVEHQRVNRPSTSKIPLPPPPEGSPRAHPPFTEGSGNTHGSVTEDSLQEGKGKELGKGKEENHASLTEGSLQNHVATECIECGDKPWECMRCARSRVAVGA